jgi:tRNA U55 pseudouridine synthase TruB
VGHLIELQRTVLCGHQLNEAFTIESKEEISDKKISIEAMLRHLPSIVFDEKQKRELCFGKTIPVADIQNGENILNTSDKTFFAAFSATSFLGIVVRKDNHIQPFRLIRTDIDL